MPINAEAIKDGMSTAQTYAAVLASMGAFEGVKAFWRACVAQRAKKRADAEDRVKAAEEGARSGAKATARLEDAEHQQARAMRKDAVDEWQAIAKERAAERQEAHARLDSIQKQVDECNEDRANLRARMNQHESRLTKMENGGGNAYPEA